MCLQIIAHQMFDVFVDTIKVTRSHIPVTNAYTRINVITKQFIQVMTDSSTTWQKCISLLNQKILFFQNERQ